MFSGTEAKKPNIRKGLLKRVAIFLLFELLFSAVTMPLLIFYGPFGNVKKTIVGASLNTFKHQYIARIFLSEDAIQRILGGSVSNDLIVNNNQEVHTATFNNNHTDKIEVFNIEGEKFKGKIMIIHDPTRVQVGYSSQLPKAGETTSAISKRNGSVAAINAGGFVDEHWAGTGGAPMGFIIHDQKVIYNQSGSETIKQDTVAITTSGSLVVGEYSIQQLKKAFVKEGVSFGPPLILNGSPVIKKGDGGWGIAPRTAIGQRADGAIVFLAIDGRSVRSLGATLRDVQEIFKQYNVINAANLDGGSSTTMYYKDKVINTPADALGERSVPSIFMSVDSKGGNKS